MKLLLLLGGWKESAKGKVLTQKKSNTNHGDFLALSRVPEEMWTVSLAFHLFSRQPRSATYSWGFKGFFDDFTVTVPIHCALLGTFNT